VVAYRREPGEIPIKGDDFAAVLQGDCRDDRIGNQIPHGVGFLAALLEQGEVSFTGLNVQVVGLGTGGFEELERVSQWCGDREDPSVGGEPEE